MKRRIVSLLLAACMMLSLLPSTAWATGEGAGTGGTSSGKIAAHENCGAKNAVAWSDAAEAAASEETQGEGGETPEPSADEGTDPAQDAESGEAGDAAVQPRAGTASAVMVKSFTDLEKAVQTATVEDIVLTTGEAEGKAIWEWTSTLNINDGRTIHITVEEGKTITLKRASTYTGGVLFNVTNPGQLILGDGTISTDNEEALKKGNYEVTQSGGELIIDGGAVWQKGNEYTPSESTFDENTIVFYDDNNQHALFANTGEKAINSTASLIYSTGTLDIWDGVTLQNNNKQKNENCNCKLDTPW